MNPFFVYLLRCADDAFYVGHTDDLALRMAQHESGAVAGFTCERRPVQLVWSQETATREEALAAELQIKGWSRAKKAALIKQDWALISDLAHQHGGQKSSTPSVRPAPVEGPVVVRATLRQAQGERDFRESVEQALGMTLRQAQGERVVGEGLGQVLGTTRRQVQAAQGLLVPVASSEGSIQMLRDQILGVAAAPQRRAIAKAITLLESTRADHRAAGDALLTELLPHTGRSFRLGISGVPGVGKSTFIEALGMFLIARGHRVAVLTVDPSSSVSGGSILGDKTRMERLSMDERAYIRPSPSSGTLGGVAEKTREAMLVCEAAGYDMVIVETVGVGQSETAVAGMTDMYVLLQLPNAGDDLQAIKKGVMELADLVVINKADLDADAATRARAQISSSLRMYGPHGHGDAARTTLPVWQPQVMQLSALKGEGLDRFWDAVSHYRQLQEANAQLAHKRQQQALAWMWERIQAGLRQQFSAAPAVRAALGHTTEQVLQGHLAPSTAARQLLGFFSGDTSHA